jgi:hypothetical protein
MPEFIAMLGSAPGPKSLGQSPPERIPNFSVASIATRGNLQGIPDFSVNSIARRGNLRGLGQLTAGSIVGGSTGTLLNFGTGNAAAQTPATSAGTSTATNRSTCKAVIPLAAFIQLTNDRISAWSKFRDYAGIAFPMNFIPQNEIVNDIDKRWFRDFRTPDHGAASYTPPGGASMAWRQKYDSFGAGATGQAYRWYRASTSSPARVTGPYKLEDEILAYAAGFLAKEAVQYYIDGKARYDANPELFKNEIVAKFLLQPTDDPTKPNYAESIVLRAAAAYIAASLPGTLKSITDSFDLSSRYNDPAAVIGARDSSRTDGNPYLNTLIDKIYGWKSSAAAADPVSAAALVPGLPELTTRIAAAATVMGSYINSWSNVRALPSVTLNMSQSIVDSLPDDLYRVLCSFDPNLYIDPAKRTPSYILTSDAATQKAQAIKDAIAAAQLVSVPEEQRLYSFSQLQAAKEQSKTVAFSNCNLSAMDQNTISQRVEDAILSRQLSTPAQVDAAVNAAKAALQKLVDDAEGKYDDYVSQDRIDDAAAVTAANKVLTDAKAAADKALEEAKSAGTNKMLIAAGAVAAVAVVALLVMRKKG